MSTKPPSGSCTCPLARVRAEQHLHRMTDAQPAERLLDGPMTVLTMPRPSAQLSRQGLLWAVSGHGRSGMGTMNPNISF